MASFIIGFCIAFPIVLFLAYGAYWQYRKIIREAKNYERGLKMVPLLIHLPPSNDDLEVGNRDTRDVIEEVISQAQIMYNIISSTATKGFKSKIYGQRHIAFEIISTKGLINYYVVVPLVLMDVVKQAVLAAYPNVRFEEKGEYNLFSEVGKISGTIGGELTLRRDFSYPIATFQETKRDAMQAILNALSVLGHEDGAGIQLLLRPAYPSWTKSSIGKADTIRNKKGAAKGFAGGPLSFKDLAEALWKPPTPQETRPEDKQLTNLEQATIAALEEKTRYPAYEILIRMVVSSNSATRSQAILRNIVAAFSLFDSPDKNGFKFAVAKDIEAFVTAFIFRFFPQELRQSILNSVELSTIFHFPDQRNTLTSQVQRQNSKQVDGPAHTSKDGLLFGYNIYRSVKKEIRLAVPDRRRHVYIIGQTGTGKSGLLENLALQDMLDGKGFAFIDPHGDSVERLLGMVPRERVEDVIYFSPGDMEQPIGLNLFEFDTNEQKDFLIQEAISMLYRLYDPGHTGIIGPLYEHWFRNAALTLMSDPNGSSFIDIPQVFNDKDFAQSKLKYVKDQTVLDFWNKEMAQTTDYRKSEILGWFVSKFGAFLSNEMMRNIIGQTKSGFNLRDIMDNKKILLVNLSQGRTGELNSQLLGMIFVMKFQTAAMGRANIPEDKRVDFSLYVDEFQNFATDSFESILSQARKYRLSLVLANQFMTQLNDKIREAVIGNVGTVVSGRIGTTDAELLAKKFRPTFEAEDLAKLPNFEVITSVMINNVPSAPFSMTLVPPLGDPNPQLTDALKRLSAAKFGRPRRIVEQEIFKRLRGDAKISQAPTDNKQVPGDTSKNPTVPATSFLDEWLEKRRQKGASAKSSQQAPKESKNDTVGKITTAEPKPQLPIKHEDQQNAGRANAMQAPYQQGLEQSIKTPTPTALDTIKQAHLTFGTPIAKEDHKELKVKPEESNEQVLKIQRSPEPDSNDGVDYQALGQENSPVDEIFIDIRGELHHAKQGDDTKDQDSSSTKS
jgi:hypothetical protein